jgi:hypothetical protein
MHLIFAQLSWANLILVFRVARDAHTLPRTLPQAQPAPQNQHQAHHSPRKFAYHTQYSPKKYASTPHYSPKKYALLLQYSSRKFASNPIGGRNACQKNNASTGRMAQIAIKKMPTH